MSMTPRLRLQIAWCFVALAVAVANAAEPVAIVGARIHTVQSDEPIDDATLILRDGRIESVGAGIAVPEDATIIDGSGLVVTPGIMNSATQLGLTEVSSVEETNDFSVTTGPVGAVFDVQYGLNPNSELIRQARADGLTRAISYPEASVRAPFAGLGMMLRLMPEPPILEEARIGLFAEVGGQSAASSGGSRSAQWLLLRHALDAAKERRRPDRVLGDDAYLVQADLEVLRNVTERKLPLVIEANRESDIREAISLGDDYGIRIIVKGGIEAWAVADELASSETPVILDPSINLPLYFDQMQARADNAALLDAAGVTISFKVSSIHTSFNAGFALREVAGLAVANGLSYASALAALTCNPAKIWGIDDRYGVIAAGQDADIVLWDGDPFEPSSTPVAVFVAGAQISSATRQKELRDRYIRHRASYSSHQ